MPVTPTSSRAGDHGTASGRVRPARAAPPAPRTEVHVLRLPRLVTGVLQRCRETERVAMWDEVPVEIGAYDPAEAPVAFHRRAGNPGVRVAGGVAYDCGLAAPGESPAMTWQGIVDDVEPVLMNRLDMGNFRRGSIYQDILPWAASLEGASRKRGITRVGELAFRTILDDGLAGQASLAVAVAARLAVIDGQLAIRGGLPRLHVGKVEDRVGVRGGMAMLQWSDDPDWGDAWTESCFRMDRPDEAHDYAAALSRVLGTPLAERSEGDEPVIVDPAAVAECYDRMAPEDDLAMIGAANGAAEAIRPALGILPESEIARYLELKALARARDGVAIRAWLDGLPATRAALADAAPPYPNGQPREMAKHVAQLDAVSARLESVDFPRMALTPDDEAALAVLGPGQ